MVSFKGCSSHKKKKMKKLVKKESRLESLQKDRLIFGVIAGGIQGVSWNKKQIRKKKQGRNPAGFGRDSSKIGREKYGNPLK